ncbi:integrin beta-PS-like, partial [Centruroides sculpturatus]|uniref:integrin beta-PS-like n=1 Tax=Centruroides sculpturatus TaxID=218467 RepID=UPI000C6C97CF
DYPSLSQINKILVENKINVIFAVPEQKIPLYNILSSKIEASYAGKLLKDSSNIVHLIQGQYNKIRSKVILKNSSNEFMKVTYVSKCLGDNAKETNVCENMTVGTTVDFDITVELLSCPQNSSLWNTNIEISPIGLQEYLQVDVDMLCECDCEKPENEIVKSENCSYAGTFECGICTCEKNHYGKECECDEIQHSKLFQCQQTNTSELCSGRGECICGECDCYAGPGDEEIFGQYCQCDTFSCERDSEGKICGGPSRGICCGKCICQPGWTGDDCDCTEDQSTCIASIGNSEPLVCSGHGDCICGKCKCHNDEHGSYTGLYCEDCNYLDVLALAVRKVENKNEKLCVFKDNDGCSFTFKYTYNESNELYIFAQNIKECPKPINVPLVVGIVAGGVFLIGLIAVLIIRFCIHLKDLRDYKKFQEEVDKLKWGQETNPLYKKAVSSYQNPTYNPKNN